MIISLFKGIIIMPLTIFWGKKLLIIYEPSLNQLSVRSEERFLESPLEANGLRSLPEWRPRGMELYLMKGWGRNLLVF
jgi:hypothetical protein